MSEQTTLIFAQRSAPKVLKKLIGVENFNEQFDRDTPPFASQEAACRFSSQTEVGFKILLECQKIALWGAFYA